MKIELLMVGKTSFSYLEEGILMYSKRLTHYLSFSTTVIPDQKNVTNINAEQLKKLEGATILKKILADDYLVLLDEQGKSWSSVEFSKWIEKKLQSQQKRIIFLIGGAYGFSEDVYSRANEQWSLSKLTFSHQMIRLFAVEQIYRAMTIIKNEPYHNS